ncbi:peroxisomal N(1)-acetyl-spermine/spermidine oxidase-like [Leptopilina heterotoma]|uniref:peroxisomal N(1)-acetyl-spermine/spermidine oxidase-like n=1 Tax=Leptopilina heterotoma TaxID=63436 RepID=UPI001CA94F7A|nr:peroxisomal N(1)-acetyl-spermine/spermidine oxidase-like [Leptopilina heterotoma]
MENGFNDVKILEAENRIGGRIFTTNFAGKKVELGAQWVYGAEGNVVYKLASPYGVIDKGDDRVINIFDNVIDSDGNVIKQDTVSAFNKFFAKVEEDLVAYAEKNKNSPLGDYFKNEIHKYVESHQECKENKDGLTRLTDMTMMSIYSANSWDNVSTVSIRDFHSSPGEFFISWKTNGYKTLLDILMKRFPKPEEELPVMKNTKLNAEVESIDYSDPNGKVKVKTTNGDEYTADYVIVTSSVGVLKIKHKSMFKPILPDDKQKAIEGTGFGNVGKVYLSFDAPWWKEDMDYGINLIWKNKDLENLEKDNKKNWLRGLAGFTSSPYMPNILEAWISGVKNTEDMEKLSDDEVKSHVVEIMNRFFGKTHTVTNPTGILRSKWLTNKNFMGSLSYRSVESDPDVANPTKLSEPIGKGKPVVLFAGEATSPHHFATVHGALETGWREAERIMKQHPNIKK